MTRTGAYCTIVYDHSITPHVHLILLVSHNKEVACPLSKLSAFSVVLADLSSPACVTRQSRPAMLAPAVTSTNVRLLTLLDLTP